MDVLRNKAEVGRKVAVIGAGGIGFDVSEYLLGEQTLKIPAKKRIEDVPHFLNVRAGPHSDAPTEGMIY